jgi:hypothetical protein
MACKGVPDVVKVKISVVSPVPSCSPKLGELLKPYRGSQERTTDGKYLEGKILREGISKKQSHFAQTLANNMDTIEEVILEAHENEESPRNGDRSHERKMSAFHSKNTGKNFIGVTFK